MADADPIDSGPPSEAFQVIAIGAAHVQAAAWIDATYVMDEAGRNKLMRIVVKIARSRLRSGMAFAGGADIDALARLAAQVFVDVQSGTPA